MSQQKELGTPPVLGPSIVQVSWLLQHGMVESQAPPRGKQAVLHVPLAPPVDWHPQPALPPVQQ
jgi:hypothetical protein